MTAYMCFNVRKLTFFCYCIVFQIRQEKPFYMADAEVDSLVSTILLYFFSTHFYNAIWINRFTRFRSALGCRLLLTGLAFTFTSVWFCLQFLFVGKHFYGQHIPIYIYIRSKSFVYNSTSEHRLYFTVVIHIIMF